MSEMMIAIDLGRYNSVACVSARPNRGHAFRTFGTSPAEPDKLLARHPGGLVVIEACANCALSLMSSAFSREWVGEFAPGVARVPLAIPVPSAPALPPEHGRSTARCNPAGGESIPGPDP
jgi:hypothetical protein